MKKILLFASALAGLFLAGSCQRENLEPQADKQVTFTIEAPAAMQTKAIADGLNVDELIYEVWITGQSQSQNQNQEVTDLSGATRLYQAKTDNKTVADGKVSFKITLDLVNDQNFTVLFWAQKKGINVYNTANLTGVTYTNTAANAYSANDNQLDAFYGKAFVSDGQTATPIVTLKRPFAQVNLCTLNNKDAAMTSDNYNISLVSSKMALVKVPTVFNVATSAATEEKPMEFAANTVPSGDDKMITVNGRQYFYAGMNYVFAGSNITLTYDIQTKLNGTVDANINNTIQNVPLKENYRTNIVGNLLTSKTDYEIIVDAEFASEYVGPEFVQIPAYDAQSKTWTVTNADELAWVAASVNGTIGLETKAGAATKTFKGENVILANDIDLGGALWTPIGYTTNYSSTDPIYFAGTFDGNGKTIRNFKVVTIEKHAGFFGHVRGGIVKDVTFDNAEIICNPSETAAPAAAVVVAAAPYGANIFNVKVTNSTVNAGGYIGAIAGYVAGTITGCEVKDCELTAVPYMYKGVIDNGAKVGGVLGYQQGDGNAGAGFSNVVENNKVENVVIRGTRDLGGVVGLARVKVNNCAVKNVEIYANQTLLPAPENYELGEVVGRGPKEGTGNVVEKVSIYHEFDVKNIDELNSAISSANTLAGTSLINFTADIAGNATIRQAVGADIVFNGHDKKFDGTFTLQGGSQGKSPETLTFKNIKFNHTEAGDFYFIDANSADVGERYVHNVTVDNCDFTGCATAAAMRFRQSYDINVTNVTADGIHSLLQVYGTSGIIIDNATVEAGRGVSLGSSTNVTIKNSTFTVESYGIRGNGDGGKYDINIAVEKTTVNAAQPVVIRKVTDAEHTYKVTLTGATLNPTKAGDYQVIFTNGADDAAYVEPAGNWEINDKSFNIFPKEPVAKVGNTEYYSIDEAIAAWTNNTTLTLLDNVTLTDVISLKSTEYHILDLGTYTMTAASKKDAIKITAEGRSSASYALDIKADATNPGGITATGKTVVITTGKSGLKDRPIIRFYNGVFNASNIIKHSGSNGTNCPQFQFHNGVYNGTISANRAMIHFYGGTFHGTLSISVDSSAYGLISGGRFKELRNWMGSELNSEKFTIGSAKGVFDRGVYVDDEGYFVVGGPSITEFTNDFEARVPIAPGVNDYLYYSSAKSVGYLYYTNKDKVKKSDESKMELNPSFNN